MNKPLRSLLMFALALIVCGCAGKDEGTVSGRVTFKDQPVVGWLINFQGVTHAGVGASAALDTDGQYQVSTPLPSGSYIVYVMPPVALSLTPGVAPPPAPRDYPNLPRKYRSEMTSDLKAEVKRGNNPIDFQLMP